jgi:hypothetical protein
MADNTILDYCFDEAGAANFLDNSERTLQRWRALKEGPRYVRVGHRVYYPKNDLIKWALGQTQAA